MEENKNKSSQIIVEKKGNNYFDAEVKVLPDYVVM